jgi:two-component system, LytTR family, response regulator
MYTAIIVDDQQLHHEEISDLLKQHPPYRIVGNSYTVEDAIDMVKRIKPNLVFLDVNIPPHTGFDFIRTVGRIDFDIIFITSNAEYAARAFDVSAVDFLLKPIRSVDMSRALKRFERKFETEKAYINMEKFVTQLYSKMQLSPKIAIADAKSITLIELNKIVRLQADGRCTRVFLNDGSAHTSTKTLGEMENELLGYTFQRVHDTHIINMEYLSKYIRGDGGQVIMKDKSCIDVSRPYKKLLVLKIQQL